ncbi:DUF4388 domain-containing protein [Oscillochloris sp. ZM17-4]|uniref:DUF4388 domain-containing protein n=1 Tax=Oscillochloris sp. ZM17-4 TaxID=2866714 RepID=UPI001C73AB96|nr:DUF4388 domain-containing protein [Oscillochloris sp. ZM17-4]MBX0327519.1 DUF4388 domain-containing protein [Oscillochloris sp. ZM17-4]
MALEGDLSEFPLTDIIQLVDLSKKTGGVSIRGLRGSQHFDGWLYFRDGKIVGAEMDGHTPLDAVYTFFTLSSGPFRFHDERVLSQPTITVSNEVIIMEGIMRQDEWATIHEHVPSLNLVPRLVPNPTTGNSEINLEAEEWRILTMVNGKNTIGQIAQRSGLGEVRTCEIVAQLLQSGLIENREIAPGEALAPEFERIAAGLLGTSASAVLQEAYKQAGVFDTGRATGDQMLAVVDYFEMGATRLVGAARASGAAEELRARMHEVIG